MVGADYSLASKGEIDAVFSWRSCVVVPCWRPARLPRAGDLQGCPVLATCKVFETLQVYRVLKTLQVFPVLR